MRCGTRWRYRGWLCAPSCEGVVAVADDPAVGAGGPAASVDGLAFVVAVFAGCLAGCAAAVCVGCLAGSAAAGGEADPAAAYGIAGSGQ